MRPWQHVSHAIATLVTCGIQDVSTQPTIGLACLWFSLEPMTEGAG